MQNDVLVLGFETSCDDTAVAVLRLRDGQPELLFQAIYTQYKEHFEYGGVVPEIASRAHLERLPTLVQDAVKEACVSLADIDAVCATVGPGLVGGLLMGATYAKTLAMSLDVPFVGVNHIEGHALSPFLAYEPLAFPYLLMLVSGGHCQLVKVSGLGEYETLGRTLDDAAGECFDKVARMLGLSPAHGGMLEQVAAAGDASALALSSPKIDGLDFSFSGLKSNVMRVIRAEELRLAEGEGLSDSFVANVAAATMQVAATHLAKKAEQALAETGLKTLVAAGGVAASTTVRGMLADVAASQGVRVVFPPMAFCTDNAAMIALAGAMRFAAGQEGELMAAVRPRWPLDEMEYLKR